MDNWPAHPDDPQGIRVASVIEFSVCLFSVLLKFSNLFILQYNIRSGPPKPAPATCLILNHSYSIRVTLCYLFQPSNHNFFSKGKLFDKMELECSWGGIWYCI